jgi:hypothetical protein
MRLSISSIGDVCWIYRGYCDFWQYPTISDGAKPAYSLSALYFNQSVEYGPPPSEVLRNLIKARAPHDVIVDRFCEEYPQWAETMLGWYWASRPMEVTA